MFSKHFLMKTNKLRRMFTVQQEVWILELPALNLSVCCMGVILSPHDLMRLNLFLLLLLSIVLSLTVVKEFG